jgi:hypothetical protein
MTRYALAHHVFVCIQDEHVVFLDVRRDRYFTLRAEQTRALESCVRGWPVRGAATGAVVGSDSGSGSAALALLIERGLIMGADQTGKDATPIQIEPPLVELAPEACEHEPHVNVLALSRFVRATCSARLTLRYSSFDRVIDRERARRTREVRGSAGSEVLLDRSRAHELVTLFATLRPYFFSAKHACLFETLALRKFLASYRVRPRWVFGVQARPFAAHCWLQQDGVVFNDTVEYVSRYTPIMVI